MVKKKRRKNPKKVKTKTLQKEVLYIILLVLIFLIIFLGSYFTPDYQSNKAATEGMSVQEDNFQQKQIPLENTVCEKGSVFDGAACIALNSIEDCGPFGHSHGSECHCDEGSYEDEVEGKKVCLPNTNSFLQQPSSNNNQGQGFGQCMMKCMEKPDNVEQCKNQCNEQKERTNN